MRVIVPHPTRTAALLVCAQAALLVSQAMALPPTRSRTLTYHADQKEWVEQAPPARGTPEGDVFNVAMQLREGAFRAAIQSVKAYVATHGEADPHYPEAMIGKIEALIGLKHWNKAHLAAQEFLNRFPASPFVPEALRLEFIIAEAYLGGAKRKVWGGLLRLSGVDAAYRILDDLSARYPESRIAELAIKAKADHLFRVGDHALAELEYARLLRDFPQSRYRQYALRRTAEAALASFGGVLYDEAALIEAEERFQDFRSQYPTEAGRENVGLILDSIGESRAAKELSIGQYYERTNHIASAVYYYKMLRAEWPQTAAAAKATARLELIGAPGSSNHSGGPENEEGP